MEMLAFQTYSGREGSSTLGGSMRFVYAVIAIGLWAWFLSGAHRAIGIDVSNDLQCLTIAIVAAGALAGGD